MKSIRAGAMDVRPEELTTRCELKVHMIERRGCGRCLTCTVDNPPSRRERNRQTRHEHCCDIVRPNFVETASAALHGGRDL